MMRVVGNMLKRVGGALWRPRMPVAVFAVVTIALGILLALLAFSGSSGTQPGQSNSSVVAPPGYAVTTFQNMGKLPQTIIDQGWICLGDNSRDDSSYYVTRTCFVPLKDAGASGGLTVEQWVSIGTFALGVITGLGGLLVGWRTATAAQRPPDPSPGAA